MQSVSVRKMHYGVGFSGINQNTRTASTTVPPVQPAIHKPYIAPATDQVRFGKIENITGPIPPNSLVVLVPGMCSPAQSMRSLSEYLQARGHTTRILESPFNIRAGSARASIDWLRGRIDRIRLEEASNRYIAMLSKMEALPHEARVDFLRQALNLKPDELGQATARAALGMVFKPETGYEDESDFTILIRKLRDNRKSKRNQPAGEEAHKELVPLTASAHEQLRRVLRPVFLKGVQDEQAIEAQSDALDKTVDHVIDQIAPRVVLVGHSMGGFVSMLTLFKQAKDTGMVVALSAPGENGTEHIPSGLALLKRLPVTLQNKGREVLEKIAPGLEHMLGGSLESYKLKANHQPFNTTILAVGLPGDYDGLVGEQNFRMNDALPGRINVLVTPRKANLVEIGSHSLNQLHQLLSKNAPLYDYCANFVLTMSKFLTGIAYHCGLTQHHDKYWPQNGEILRGIMEAPKNAQNEYDYQSGKPDYGEAVQQIQRLLAPWNYEAERLHVLNLLEDTLSDAQKEEPSERFGQLKEVYAPLIPILKKIQREKQPIRPGVADKANDVLALLESMS